MARARAVLLLLPVLALLAGCAGYFRPPSTSPCTLEGEASYACQIERYNRVSA